MGPTSHQEHTQPGNGAVGIPAKYAEFRYGYFSARGDVGKLTAAVGDRPNLSFNRAMVWVPRTVDQSPVNFFNPAALEQVSEFGFVTTTFAKEDYTAGESVQAVTAVS